MICTLPAGSDVEFGWCGHRDPPEDLVAGLQAVDPDADIMWVPGFLHRPPEWDVGVWWEPNAYHRREAGQILERHAKMPAWDGRPSTQGFRRNPKRIKYAKDILDGWRIVFRIQGRHPDGRDVKEFAKRDWLFRNTFERIINQRMEALTPAELKRQEAAEQDEFSARIRDRAMHDTAAHRLIQGGFSVLTHGQKEGG